MSDPLLTVDAISLGFHNGGSFAHILDGANLEMNRGEIMGLVGESGCGKTTLASAILGVLPRSALEIKSGAITFDGVDMVDPACHAQQESIRGRRVTFIPQDPFTSLNPVFTIGQQIEDLMKWKSPRRPLGQSRWPSLLHPYPRARRKIDREKILEMLSLVQLPRPDQLLKKYPHEVSGGQRQRLMIAMALLPEPDLIIADEPTTALDVTIQAQILGLLRGLATDRGVAVMLTTHDLGSAYEICDRITVMYAGQDVEVAPVDEFFNRPSHPYTSKLLASRPEGNGGMMGIPGELPSFYAPPSGCRFQTRCDRATEACQMRPPSNLASPNHIVRCFHPLESTTPATELPAAVLKESRG